MERQLPFVLILAAFFLAGLPAAGAAPAPYPEPEKNIPVTEVTNAPEAEASAQPVPSQAEAPEEFQDEAPVLYQAVPEPSSSEESIPEDANEPGPSPSASVSMQTGPSEEASMPGISISAQEPPADPVYTRLERIVYDWWWDEEITDANRDQWFTDVQREGTELENDAGDGAQHLGVWAYTIQQGDAQWLNDLPPSMRNLVNNEGCSITLEISILSPHSNEEPPMRSILIIIHTQDGNEYSIDPYEDPPVRI
ncbi:MAG TPA: hypothetical protein VL688_06935 [Verrucomicrobiae bacterium]|nr:hypothetical protein [Verrucomicrobiae bacterium]